MSLILPFRARWLRNVAYGAVPAPLLRRLKRAAGAPDLHARRAYWNQELAGRMSAPSLNGRISTALRDSVTAHMVAGCGPSPARVLDVGCGFATAAAALADHGLRRYVGLDLSDFVIDTLRRDVGAQATGFSKTFHCADLRTYKPSAEDGQAYDLIIFNEVLKYLEIDEAIRQLERYARWLADGGLYCIALSEDAKCRALFRAAHRRFEWVYGTLYQQCPDGPRYRLRVNRAVPPFLVGLFRGSST